MQTHKQIAFKNQNVAGYIKNLVILIDRDRYWASVNLDWLTGIEEVSEPANSTFLEQFLNNLHVFNVTTCNDHLEPTWIYPNTSKVHFIIGYANYIKI